MGTLEKKKIFFEEADRPPPSYYDGSLEKMPLRKLPFQTPDPEKWLKAPEFVPRTKMLAEAFAPPLDCVAPPFAIPPTHAPPYVAAPPFPPMVPMPPAATGPIAPRMPVIPNGYTVNITNLNQGVGPPIPAIVLRKKRRKRNKNTQSLVMNSSESPSSSHPLDPNGYASDRNGATTPDDAPIVEDDESSGADGKQLLSGSCPDLSEEQLEMWDNYLYAAAVDSKEKKERSTPPSSPKQDVNEASDSTEAIKGLFPVYDVLPRSLRDVAEQQLDGFSNPEIRRLDREINGNNMSSSMVIKRLSEQRFVDSDCSTQRSLAAEMKELTFRPEISRYGYPKIDAPRVQLATFHPNSSVRTQIANRCIISDSESDPCEEDCFEGMNITVNAFDVCDDLTLSDIEKAPTRFEQIHQALKQNTQRYTADLRPPERVCCVLM
nr:Protein T04B2.3, isoform b [Haemonchus contortus]